MNLATQPVRHRPKPIEMTVALRPETIRRLLLICGILSSLVYVALNIVGALQWKGYSSVSQAVSELSAFGSPSRPFVMFLGTIYGILIIAFGVGVWASGFTKKPLRIVGGLLMAYGVIGFAAPFSSMHMRGVAPTHTDTMHIWLTVVTVTLMFLTLAFGAVSLGRRFCSYTLVTITLLVVFGILAAMDGPRLQANLPTPWLGLTERINIGVFLLWIIVLAVQLWSPRTTEDQI